jgi:very-short-patch-repair endonuclease
LAKTKRKNKKDPEELKQFLLKQGEIFSQQLTLNATEWEKILINTLNTLGYNYKFQVPIVVPITKSYKLYILDFLLTDYNIFIEADGKACHTSKEQIKSDNLRTKRLSKLGYVPLRLTNKQIQTFTNKQIDEILKIRINMLSNVNKLGTDN